MSSTPHTLRDWCIVNNNDEGQSRGAECMRLVVGRARGAARGAQTQRRPYVKCSSSQIPGISERRIMSTRTPRDRFDNVSGEFAVSTVRS